MHSTHKYTHEFEVLLALGWDFLKETLSIDLKQYAGFHFWPLAENADFRAFISSL